MTQIVRQLLEECVSGKNSQDYLFTREDRAQVVEFHGAWAAVCCAAGVGELLCRNCDQSGPPRSTARIVVAIGPDTN